MAQDKKTLRVKTWAEIYGATVCTPRQIHDLMLLTWGTPCVLCVVGEAGIGKTHVLKQAAEARKKELGVKDDEFGFLYVMLAHKDREHITGLYYFSKDGTTFHAMHHEEMARELAKPHGLLFFDEFNRPRDPALLNAFFAYLSERGANGLHLGPGWSMVGAINPSTASYMVSNVEQDSAFRRRMTWVQMEFSAPEWFSYASSHKKKFHPQILRYLLENPARVYDKDAQDSGKIGATPAGWEDVSALVWANEARGKLAFSKATLAAGIAGKVGHAVAQEFIEMYSPAGVKKEYPTVMQLVTDYRNNPNVRGVVQEIAAKEAIAGAKNTEDVEEAKGKKKGKSKKADEEAEVTDDKGWLVKSVEAYVHMVQHAPLEDLGAASVYWGPLNAPFSEPTMGINQADYPTEGEWFEALCFHLASQMVAFSTDLPRELFATLASLWAEGTKDNTEIMNRVMGIVMHLRDFPEWVTLTEEIFVNSVNNS